MPNPMDRFDSLDDMPLFGDDPLPSELEPLRQRVLQDSALWRGGLPGTDTLVRQVTTLAHRKPESRLSSYRIREELYMQDPTRIETPLTQPQVAARPAQRPAPSRARGALAVSAALVLVALFVAFFAALPHGGQKPHITGPASAKATPTMPQNRHGNWQPVASLTHTPGVPVIAPSNTSVVYDTTNGAIRRSTDGGATWISLPNPSDFPAGDTPQWMDLFVSPLNPDIVWTTANLTNPGGAINCPVPPPFASTESNIAQGGSHLYAANIPSGGSVPCQVQNVSTDGGKTWKLVKLSFAFMLGTINADSGAGSMYGQFSMPPQVQGNRLYTLTTVGPLAMSNSGGLVAMSTDGGLTWHDASAQLTNAGQDVCNLAVVPGGSSLFAVTNPNGCSIDGASAPSLWRSDDAGAHWRQVSFPPNRFVLGMSAVGGAQPVLYVQTATLSHSHAANTTALATDFFASSNGGQSWTQSPSHGVPATIVGSSTMTVLGNGTVVVPFISINSQAGPNGPATVTFEQWQPGQGAWQEVSHLSLYGVAQLQTLPDPATGADALWLTSADSSDPQGSTFSVETYLP